MSGQSRAEHGLTQRSSSVGGQAGNSSISADDYAVTLLDEIEEPQFRRCRMTVGY
jgi:putative NADH-flavin reductase